MSDTETTTLMTQETTAEFPAQVTDSVTTPYDAPAPEAVEEAPKSVKLTVKRVKSAATVIAPEVAGNDIPVPEGTRMETDGGPVQGTKFLAEPREEDVLEFPGLVITRQRF